MDYLHEVEDAGECILRRNRCIDATIKFVPESRRMVFEGLEGLLGVAKIAAVALTAELGPNSCFEHRDELTGQCEGI